MEDILNKEFIKENLKFIKKQSRKNKKYYLKIEKQRKLKQN